MPAENARNVSADSGPVGRWPGLVGAAFENLLTCDDQSALADRIKNETDRPVVPAMGLELLKNRSSTITRQNELRRYRNCRNNLKGHFIGLTSLR